MKKFFSVLLCLVFVALTLVGCGDVDRGEWLNKDDGKYKDYDTDTSIPQVPLNLYIIVEDETVDGDGVINLKKNDNSSSASKRAGEVTQAINTVSNAIKDFTTTNYNSPVNVIYVKESDYEEVVYNAVIASGSDANAANIVLVNSYSLMQKLYATGKLCALDSYLATTKFGTLNTAIPTSLLEASKFETVVDGAATKTLYSIPNNHVIGSYEYLLVNEDLAIELKINDSTVNALSSYDDAILLFESKMAASNKTWSDYGIDNPSNAITLVSGSYEDRAIYEDQGYYCNVIKNPIADKNEAFTSAFVIIDRNDTNAQADVNERAMEIVYSLNTNKKFRNLLQYGVAGTNYKLDMNNDEIVKELLKGPNTYSMNLLYTGDVMTAYICEEIGWDATTRENAIHQNADSVTVAAAPATETAK